MKKRNNLTKLIRIMEILREPDGCPWDREQTLKSLVPFVIEEAYEVIEAIDERSYTMLEEELGDLLHQIIFICQLAKEKGRFDMLDVVDSAIKKMIRRHVHVFGKEKADNAGEAIKHWTRIKMHEKKKRKKGYLSDIPPHLPALLRAHKVSEKAARVGFDWQDINNVFEKMEEEVKEFKSAVNSRDIQEIEEELGDILFTIVNIGRFIEVNPEDALRKTVGKFIARFHFIEKSLKKEGKDLNTATLEEMEKLWNNIKKKESQKSK